MVYLYVMRNAFAIGLAFVLLCFATPSWAQKEHVVKKGETPVTIAKLYGVTPNDILQVNKINPRKLMPGMTLIVPDKKISTTSSKKEKAVDSIVQAQKVTIEPIVSEHKVHVVKKGESPATIAKLYGVTPNDILQANNINPRKLMPGMILKIPVYGAAAEAPQRQEEPQVTVVEPAPVANAETSAAPAEPSASVAPVQEQPIIEHVVKKGDTLSSIARHYGVSPKSVMEYNDIKSPRSLQIGQRLKLSFKGSIKEILHRAAQAESIFMPYKNLAHMAFSPDEDRPELKELIVEFAKTMVGTPYRFGGSTLRGIDCSAFVKRSFEFFGIELPRSSIMQYAVGEPVDRDALEVGDLVFFRTRGNRVSHVGIHIGDGKFIHAAASKRSIRRGVKIDSLDSKYYSKRFVGAKRLYIKELQRETSVPIDSLQDMMLDPSMESMEPQDIDSSSSEQPNS